MRTCALECHCTVRVRAAAAHVGTEYLCAAHGATRIDVVRPVQTRPKLAADSGSALF